MLSATTVPLDEDPGLSGVEDEEEAGWELEEEGEAGVMVVMATLLGFFLSVVEVLGLSTDAVFLVVLVVLVD